MPPADPFREVTIAVDRPLDLIAALGPLRRGHGDPTIALGRARAIRATRTERGPATIEIEVGTRSVRLRAWGDGAGSVLAGARDLLALDDDPSPLRPRDRLVAELVRRGRGLRIGRTGRVFESLLPAILEQKVTGDEARRAFRLLVRRYGDPAPGPFGLVLQPTPETLARLPYHAFHPLGVERRRAEVIRSAARIANRLEEGSRLALADAYARLRSIPGVGAWTAAEVGIRAFGDPDAVSVGDFHIPNLVSWALAREPRGSDERMLELLEPYRGQRGRVVRLLEASGIRSPRYGPRMAGRDIAGT